MQFRMPPSQRRSRIPRATIHCRFRRIAAYSFVPRRRWKTGAAPSWNFQVLNNTGGDALYVLDGGAAGSGTANSTRNLHAPSGWGSTGYTGVRAAAPFAILDTVYKAKELALSAKADSVFPALDLYWSPQNRPSSSFCPDVGDVVSSLYTVFSDRGHRSMQLADPRP